MDFDLPNFKGLSNNIGHLDDYFSSNLGRYRIRPINPIPDDNRNIFQILMENTQVVINCKTGRTEQLDVFKQLHNELQNKLSSNNEQEWRDAAMFLLGALLHRYFRLIKEEKDYKIMGLFKTEDLANCGLFNAIRSALCLPVMTKDYKNIDSSFLDITTVVTSLECFRDTMKQKVEETKKPRYQQYPHLANPKNNFLAYLEEIIDEHRMGDEYGKLYLKRLNKPLYWLREDHGNQYLKKYKAIHFMESLVKQIIIEHDNVVKSLDQLALYLNENHADLSKINQRDLLPLIEGNIEDKVMVDKISSLFCTEYVLKTYQTKSPQELIDDIKICHEETSRLTFWGGYALILSDLPDTDLLRNCILKSLNIAERPHVLTEIDMYHGIKFLEQFLQLNPSASVALDQGYFGRWGLNNKIAEKLNQFLPAVQRQQKRAEESIGVKI